MNRTSKILSIAFLVTILILLIVVPVALWYISKLEEQIIERDNLIQELTISEDLVKEYFNVEYDSISNTKSYILKDSKKTRVIEIEKENHYIKEYREPQFKKGDKTLSSADLVKEYNKKDSLYNQLLSQYYNECNDKNSIKKKMSIYVKILDMIEHNYGISYNIKTENRDSIIIYTYNLVHTERVDSALMLLPYYNNKLKRENDSVWTIKTPIQWNVKNKKKK
jgi:hypothetical protein